MRTLDGVERVLSPEMCVIADAARAVAVAGVMGGAESEIGAGTQNVLLESAWFDPISIRRTSKALGLRSEASTRFERGADPEMAETGFASLRGADSGDCRRRNSLGRGGRLSRPARAAAAGAFAQGIPAGDGLGRFRQGNRGHPGGAGFCAAARGRRQGHGQFAAGAVGMPAAVVAAGRDARDRSGRRSGAAPRLREISAAAARFAPTGGALAARGNISTGCASA